MTWLLAWWLPWGLGVLVGLLLLQASRPCRS